MLLFFCFPKTTKQVFRIPQQKPHVTIKIKHWKKNLLIEVGINNNNKAEDLRHTNTVLNRP